MFAIANGHRQMSPGWPARLLSLCLSFILPVVWMMPACADPEQSAPAHQSRTAGLNLDLSSSTPSIRVGERILSQTESASVNVAGTQQAIRPGDLVTPAVFAALLQTINGRNQTLLLDASNRAVGGTFSLGSLPLRHIETLVIPQGVVAVDAATRSALNVAGNLIANGILLGVPGNSNNGYNLTAGLVQVGTGGSITTQVPSSLASLFGPINTPLNLSINSLSNIINAGSIIASGTLNLTAAGSIINQATAGAPPPVMSGITGVNLSAGSGVITNAGLISAQAGNVNFSTVIGRDLLVNSTGGQVLANLGAINFRDHSYSGKSLTQLIGGQFEAQSVNFNGGNGKVSIAADQIAGALNITACETHVSVNKGDLNIASMNVSGDPTILNAGGSVTLAPNADLGQTLRFTGVDLAVLAFGDINAPGGMNLIDLSNNSGPSGNLTLVAGYNFNDLGGGTYSIGAPTTAGGNVNLGAVSVKTNNGSTGPGAQGGRVTIVAADGTGIGASKGSVAIGSIDASAITGNAGDVHIFGQRAIATNGFISAEGAHSGMVTINGGAPQMTGPITFNNGVRGGSGVFKIADDPGHAPVVVNVGGSINNTGGPGGSVLITTSGDIFMHPNASIFSFGSVALNSDLGGVSFQGNNNLAAADTLSVEAGGTGSNIAVAPGTSLVAGEDVFVLSYGGQIQDTGNNTYTAAGGALLLAAQNDLILGNGTHLFGRDVVALLSDLGAVNTGSGVHLISNGSIGILGGAQVHIGPSNIVTAGLLDPGAPFSGVLSFADIDSPGFAVIGSGGNIALQSSIAANGGDLVVAALGGNLGLAPSIGLVSNGGFVALFASGTVNGSNNSFESRAAGSPEFFTGGLIGVASGFSFHPDLVSLSAVLSANSGQIHNARSQILAASDDIAGAIIGAHSAFSSPELDLNGFILDTALVGAGVHVDDNGIDMGLFRPTKLTGGLIDISGGTIDITRGAVFLDSVGAGSHINIPGASFQVQSYDVVPTGLFKHFVEIVRETIIFLMARTTLDFDRDAAITPLDQNRLLGGLRDLVTCNADASGARRPIRGEPPVGGEKLANSNGEGEESEQLVLNQPIVDIGEPVAAEAEGGSLPRVSTGSSGGSAGSLSSSGAGDSGSKPQGVKGPGNAIVGSQRIAKQNERVTGVPDGAYDKPFHIQPVIRINGGNSELTIFTTASQVLTGLNGVKPDTIAMGAQGTTVSSENGSIVLHTGSLLTDNGDGQLQVKTRMGTVTIAPQSTAQIVDEPGKAVCVRAISGGGSSVKVESHGSETRAISLGQGEQLVLGDEHVYIASAESREISDSQQEAGRSTFGGHKAFKSTFSLDQFVDRDEVVGNRTIRLSGSKRADYDRLLSHVNNAGKAQNADFKILQAPPVMPGVPVRDNSPPRVLAREGTMFTQLESGAINLKTGTLFVSSAQPVTVKTSIGQISTHGKSMIGVDFRRGKMRVFALSGPGDVTVEAGKSTLALSPGKEVLLLSHRPSKSEACPQDGIGRRQLSAHSISKKLWMVSGDFSIVSMLQGSDILKPLAKPTNVANKQTLQRLIKLAAAVEMSSSSRGRYYMHQSEKAEIPDWPFKQYVANGRMRGTNSDNMALVWSETP